MARERRKAKKPTSREHVIVQGGAMCILSDFDPETEIPRGVICGDFSLVEVSTGPEGRTVRLTHELTITEQALE